MPIYSTYELGWDTDVSIRDKNSGIMQPQTGFFRDFYSITKTSIIDNFQLYFNEKCYCDRKEFNNYFSNELFSDRKLSSFIYNYGYFMEQNSYFNGIFDIDYLYLEKIDNNEIYKENLGNIVCFFGIKRYYYNILFLNDKKVFSKKILSCKEGDIYYSSEHLLLIKNAIKYLIHIRNNNIRE